MPVIKTYNRAEEAHMARGKLEASGIPAYVQDELTAGIMWYYTTAIGGIKLEVAEEHVTAAHEVLQEVEEASSSLMCPYCGSSNVVFRPLGLGSAVSMGLFGFPLPGTRRMADCGSCRRSFPSSELRERE